MHSKSLLSELAQILSADTITVHQHSTWGQPPELGEDYVEMVRVLSESTTSQLKISTW